MYCDDIPKYPLIASTTGYYETYESNAITNYVIRLVIEECLSKNQNRKQKIC